jgi:pilus assembly protein CpaB
MNTRAFTLALVLSAVAMFMVWTYISDQKASILNNYGKERPVVIAKEDIKELDLIDSKNLAYKMVPENFILPGYFEKIEELENTIATVPILKGEQITRPRVTYPGARGGLSREIAPGKRAIAIGVNDRTGVANLIKPGDRVDVFATFDFTGTGKREFIKTQLVLQDVLVLSTGRAITNSIPIVGNVDTSSDAAVVKKMNLNTYNQYSTITLEVEPYEAQKMIYVRSVAGGDPYIVLRNNNDKKQIGLKATQIFDVLNEEDRGVANDFFKQKK